MCITICGRFCLDEGVVVRATTTEFGQNIPQSEAYRLWE
ncbi:hypothetical protein [Blautia sp.]